jgi:hypothetical protein
MNKLGPCLLAGNTMVSKPAPTTPLTTLLFATIANEILPPGVFNMVFGEGPTVGAAMSSHPGIDMISITGSTRAGIEVARNAAATVKRVHQELGGKSPNIVLDGLEDAHAEDHIDTLEIATDDGPVVLKLVKPCARCSIPDVDPVTAEKGHAVNDALMAYRADARVNGGLTFGMNAVIVSGVEHTLKVGAAVRATLAV